VKILLQWHDSKFDENDGLIAVVEQNLNLINELGHGCVITFECDGSINGKYTLINDKLHGHEIGYNKSIRHIASFENNMRHGIYRAYDDDDLIYSSAIYRYDKIYYSYYNGRMTGIKLKK
jgi:antitoxin component YwqK of YwqJK toxin-antitoxin module